MKVHDLKPAPGSNTRKRRVGRGIGGKGGKTAGRGTKGQNARNRVPIGFEGGQMPLQRRLPKRGFTNIFKKEWVEVNVATLEKRFDADTEITPELLVETGIASKRAVSESAGVVVLGHGDLTKAFKISAHRVTKSAREKIEKAGGSVTLVGAAEAEAK